MKKILVIISILLIPTSLIFLMYNIMLSLIGFALLAIIGVTLLHLYRKQEKGMWKIVDHEDARKMIELKRKLSERPQD